MCKCELNVKIEAIRLRGYQTCMIRSSEKLMPFKLPQFHTNTIFIVFFKACTIIENYYWEFFYFVAILMVHGGIFSKFLIKNFN